VLRPATEHLVAETFSIPAMDCPEELGLIEKGLAGHAGIVTLEPTYLERRLRVSFDPHETAATQIADAITHLGFPAQIARDDAPAAPYVARPWRWYTTVAGGVLLGLAALVALATRLLIDLQMTATASTAGLAAQVLCVLSTLVAGAPCGCAPPT
jgi:cation transport ATPase